MRKRGTNPQINKYLHAYHWVWTVYVFIQSMGYFYLTLPLPCKQPSWLPGWNQHGWSMAPREPLYSAPSGPLNHIQRAGTQTRTKTQRVEVERLIVVTSEGTFQSVVGELQCGEWGTNSYQSWMFSVSALLLLGSEHQKDSEQRALWNGATQEPLSGRLPCRTDGVCVCVCVFWEIFCAKWKRGRRKRRQSERGAGLCNVNSSGKLRPTTLLHFFMRGWVFGMFLNRLLVLLQRISRFLWAEIKINYFLVQCTYRPFWIPITQ